MRKPDFFIVGAPKCGTTSLNNYLDQHPDIYMPVKELHYFGNDLGIKQKKLSESGYLEKFSKATSNQLLGETSVWYLLSKTAAREIKSFNPSAKIIIMLRDPVDMIYSLHNQLIYNLDETVTDFEQAIALEQDRKVGINLPKSIDFLQIPSYIESAKYAVQVKRYFEIFDRNKVLIILFDEFVKNTLNEFSRILKFLEVSTDFTPSFKIKNPSKKFHSLPLHRTIYAPNKTTRAIFRAFIPVKNIRAKLMNFVYNKNIKYKAQQPLRKEFKIKLQKVFTDDIRQLCQLINRDLSHWNKS